MYTYKYIFGQRPLGGAPGRLPQFWCIQCNCESAETSKPCPIQSHRYDIGFTRTECTPEFVQIQFHLASDSLSNTHRTHSQLPTEPNLCWDLCVLCVFRASRGCKCGLCAFIIFMCVSCSLSVCLVIEACVTKVDRHNTEKQTDYQTPIHRTNQPQTAPPVNMRLTATKKHYFLQNRCWPFAVSHYMPSRLMAPTRPAHGPYLTPT